MEKINDGGPAFPYEHFREAPESGMTLRDYFAAKALCGLLSDSEVRDSWEDFAISSYQMADAMLKAREAQS